MNFSILDTVVLNRGLPEFALKRGDVGAVVEFYPPESLDVEFVTGAGRKQTLVTLKVSDVHPVADNELLAVRRVDAA